MDPRRNPYSPGAGSQPPELAGRDALIERAEIALDRIRQGKAARSFVFYGLRGVGKTVLLNRIRDEAEGRGFATIHIEAPENRSLPSILAPNLRALLLKLSKKDKAKDLLQRGLRAVAGFAKALKVKYDDIEFSLDFPSEPGLADSGDLQFDLKDVLEACAQAAQQCDTAIVLFIDELQYVAEEQLAALITALHSASQKQLPITMVAAGLPQILGKMGRAKSYAERLFEFVLIDRLDERSAEVALRRPAENERVHFEGNAVAEIIKETQGYPYFLQEWGKHAWNFAAEDRIVLDDARNATTAALAELDASFFRVRFDRLTPSEKQYMRAMASLGPGPHRSGDIAARLKKKVTAVAPVRNSLIAKGMAYSPSHGDTAFTVPLFDGFLKRTIPEL
jgi:AAA+ ATPase superfamily predicted ATPase